MNIKDEEPPIKKDLILSRIRYLDLKKENIRLKRLLSLVKNHVIYDEKLYKEILEALRK